MSADQQAELAAEIAHEQSHVDRVYTELAKAATRADLVHAEGMVQGQTERAGTGDPREEEMAGLFQRDALVYTANRRRASLEQQHEGLVFGRLDLDATAREQERGETGEVRYIGRLGVRDDEYEPLVIDWRAPAASAFYRATPVERHGVIRRRVLRSHAQSVIGIEDDLMVAEAPDDMVVVGDGALMAALTRSRGQRMRDIVATIQQHQDEAIRAVARGVTEITGGPGTGKTVVALHRAAYLLYSERRRFEAGGVLVVGPSSAYTAYIERVLPSLGEESVTLRSLGDVVGGMTAVRVDSPEAAAIKGSLRMRPILGRLVKEPVPDAPTVLRAFIAGHAIRLDPPQLERARRQVLRNHQRNVSPAAVIRTLAEMAWNQVKTGERPEFLDKFEDSRDVEAFVKQWWRPVDPREVLLWLSEDDNAVRLASPELTPAEAITLAHSMQVALRTGQWSVADVALIDELQSRLGQMVEIDKEERGFYEIEELDDVSQYGVAAVRSGRSGHGGSSDDEPTSVEPEAEANTSARVPHEPRAMLMNATVTPSDSYAHVLVDEAQDLSPMQWRMLARRGRGASWTVVGDDAQSSWPDLAESAMAREDAFGAARRQSFHMTTNYRNAREIFDVARDLISAVVPDADIPEAVRETGNHPVDTAVSAADLADEVRSAVHTLLEQVDGAIALIAPAKWWDLAVHVSDSLEARVGVVDPLSSKGLEYDATVVIDPDQIVVESPGGARVLYVVLTRAAHRMSIVRPE